MSRPSILALLFAVVTAPPATAASFTLIDGQGFNSANYAAASLNGQFAATFEGSASVEWEGSQGPNTGTADVTATFVHTPDNRPGSSLPLGDQVLEVNKVAYSRDRWGVPITGAPTAPLVCVEWDMFVVEPTSTPSDAFGPLFGMEVIADDFGLNIPVFLLGVDAATGDVLYGPAISEYFATGAIVEFGEWNSYRMVLDYSTGTSYAFINDQPLAIGGLVNLGVKQFSSAKIVGGLASGDEDSMAATGTAYFDNYRVYETDDFSKIPTFGDYNDDGLVDLADYTVWRDNLGAPAHALPNDPNPGAIGAAQYDTWNSNFGQVDRAMAPDAAIAVPEPAGYALMLLVAAVSAYQRRLLHFPNASKKSG